MIIAKRCEFKRVLVGAFLLLLLLPGCGAKDTYDQVTGFFQDPDAAPVKTTLRTTIPLAYAASVAMAAVSGSAPANAHATNTCFSYPCPAVVTIDVNDQTPMPIKMGSTGKMVVAGLWTSSQNAILTVSFVDSLGGNNLFYGGSSLFRVHDVSVFPVTKTSTGVDIVYADMDVNVSTGPVDPKGLSSAGIQTAQNKAATIHASDEASANVGLKGWVVKVDQAGTPSDFSDDRYTVAGGGETLGASSASATVMQVAMAKTVMTPACKLNPTDGGAVINEIDASSAKVPVVATAVLTFNQGCSGNTKVFAATGNYLLAIGDSLPLHLDTP